jgi:predicted dienelactone hydrolase
MAATLELMISMHAGEPLETQHHPVGCRTFTLADSARLGRTLVTEAWYPAVQHGDDRYRYELLSGVELVSAGAQPSPPVALGSFPLVLFSHGRTGTRFAYATFCEALASRGCVVVSSDHPGDGLLDWLGGSASDDRTNEIDRVADAFLLLEALTVGDGAVPADVVAAIDADAILLAGHSYGAFTAFGAAAGSRGVAGHPLVRAVIGYQAYTRTMSDALLARLAVPAMLVVGGADTVTPAAVDADRPWQLLGGSPVWRLDLDGVGHQAVSDIALYAELAVHVDGLPGIVRDYLVATAASSTAAGAPPWRDVMRTELDATWAFLRLVLGLDATAGDALATTLLGVPGVALDRR